MTTRSSKKIRIMHPANRTTSRNKLSVLGAALVASGVLSLCPAYALTCTLGTTCFGDVPLADTWTWPSLTPGDIYDLKVTVDGQNNGSDILFELFSNTGLTQSLGTVSLGSPYNYEFGPASLP